jgi:hypothetical protein
MTPFDKTNPIPRLWPIPISCSWILCVKPTLSLTVRRGAIPISQNLGCSPAAVGEPQTVLRTLGIEIT